MSPLPTSPRPELIVDQNPARFVDPSGQEQGPPQPQPSVLGRDRVQFTLRRKEGARLIQPARVLHGSATYVIDTEGNLIGETNAVWVDRLLTATVTGDTRRL